MNSRAKLAHSEEFLSDDETYWMHGASLRYWLSDNAIKEKRRRCKNPEYCSNKTKDCTFKIGFNKQVSTILPIQRTNTGVQVKDLLPARFEGRKGL